MWEEGGRRVGRAARAPVFLGKSLSGRGLEGRRRAGPGSSPAPVVTLRRWKLAHGKQGKLKTCWNKQKPKAKAFFLGKVLFAVHREPSRRQLYSLWKSSPPLSPSLLLPQQGGGPTGPGPKCPLVVFTLRFFC